ncbi:MAG: AmmeMemoRadiSam system protein A [Mariprofundaceae bacterium]|nr:AmmeMemoRadiSam system protein A [Mariprofundaceae bacterium]
MNKGVLLPAIARAAITRELGIAATIPETADSPWLSDPAATFVTIKRDGELRGCIGSLQARNSLLDDLQNNAIAAAFHDPRFPPLTEHELDQIQIEVSVLSSPEKIEFVSEADLLAQLKPHVDGVIFSYGNHQSTFLPQVWEQLPDPELFMAHLKQKAGLAADFWSSDVLIYRYNVEKFTE